MIDNLEAFISRLFGGDEPDQMSDDELAIAKAALLVHCARADGHHSQGEREKLTEILTERVGLSGEDAVRVIAAAEEKEREAVDIHRFTKIVHAQLDRSERKTMVGWLWEMAHADGQIDEYETNVIALVSRLLDVEVHDSVAMRQSVVGGKLPTEPTE